MAITIFMPPNVLQASSTLRLAARELPGRSPRAMGPVVDVDQDLSLEGDLNPGAVERRPSRDCGRPFGQVSLA